MIADRFASYRGKGKASFWRKRRLPWKDISPSRWRQKLRNLWAVGGLCHPAAWVLACHVFHCTEDREDTLSGEARLETINGDFLIEYSVLTILLWPSFMLWQRAASFLLHHKFRIPHSEHLVTNDPSLLFLRLVCISAGILKTELECKSLIEASN